MTRTQDVLLDKVLSFENLSSRDQYFTLTASNDNVKTM